MYDSCCYIQVVKHLLGKWRHVHFYQVEKHKDQWKQRKGHHLLYCLLAKKSFSPPLKRTQSSFSWSRQVNLQSPIISFNSWSFTTLTKMFVLWVPRGARPQYVDQSHEQCWDFLRSLTHDGFKMHENLHGTLPHHIWGLLQCFVYNCLRCKWQEAAVEEEDWSSPGRVIR